MNYINVIDQENAINFQFENSKTEGCLINDAQGFEDAIAINSIDDVASRIGAVAVNSKSGRRVISWVARFTCDVLTKRHSMQLALRRTGFLKLVKFQTIDNLSLQFEAYFDKLKAPYSSKTNSPMLLVFSAPDPRFYSQTLKTQVIARNTTAVVANAGSDSTSPVMRINGPITAATINNLSGGESITLTYTLTAGQYVEIDMQNQTILRETGVSVYSAVTGTPEFVLLAAGNNSIQFVATGGDANTTLNVSWRDAYNGI